jgi:hypothetical protein
VIYEEVDDDLIEKTGKQSGKKSKVQKQKKQQN